MHNVLLDRMSPYDLFRYAEEQFAQRDYHGAAQALERLLEHEDADTTAARELLARAYFHGALLDKAEIASRILLERAPDNGYAALLLGRTLQRLSRHEEAEKVLARAEALGQDV